ncbi:MAG: murein biosynthesis integral membrane protein MurJ [Rickettsiales bacterium]|jgi:putative peptidoglycan lipid II flippase|nr:murein biosynthesis integral membrane protein MurJ [Rickettsiales bacterium]
MKIGKHIFKVGLWTGVSRVFGFVRDLLIANVLGAGRLSDIFLAAFKLPNMFRDLLGEGALSSVFVPMFTDARKKSRTGAAEFANNAFSWLMALLLFMTIVGVILMPIIVWILAPGFDTDPGKIVMTITISRIMFCYLLFISGTAFLGSILNALSGFALVAFMPVLLNIFMIGGLLVAHALGAGEVALFILSASVVAAGVAQMWILWSRIRQKHFGLRLVRPKWNGKIKTALKRLGVGVVGTGFYQINIIVGTIVASFQAGAVSWLYYADRMIQLPFAIIGLAMGTVLLTSISNAIVEKNMTRVYVQQNAAMRQSLLLTLPCMVGLIVLAEPIIRCLFQHGAWTADSTAAVAMAMMITALVLPAMTTSQIYTKTLYAAQDVRTPVKTSVVALIVASAIYLALFGFIGFLAVPIGTLIGGYVKNFLLYRACHRRELFRFLPKTRRAVAGFVLLSVVLGTGLWFVPVVNIFWLAGAIAVFGIIYLPIAYLINKKS